MNILAHKNCDIDEKYFFQKNDKNEKLRKTKLTNMFK